jgi:two-component system response regulator
MPSEIDVEQSPIFLVEDNPDDEGLAVRAFRKSGVKNPIVVARDGEEAVRKIVEVSNEQKLLIVLLDLKLPKLSGIEVLERIRAHDATKLVPVIVLTSSDESVDVMGCYSRGANAFVRKPVDFDEFIDAIDSIARFWLRKNLTPNSSR